MGRAEEGFGKHGRDGQKHWKRSGMLEIIPRITPSLMKLI